MDQEGAYIHVNGLRLHYVEQGRGPAILLLHGFTGSTASWSRILPALAGGCRAVAVDLIGHGRSEAPRQWERYTIAHCVTDLQALLDRLEIQQAVVLGYSMGGRVALSLAAAAPHRITALILESTSPGLTTDEERAQRRRADGDLAGMIEDQGIETFVDHWEKLPLFASQQDLPSAVRAGQRAQRLANRPWGLANSLRGMGTGSMAPLHHQLPALTMPALVIAGGLDAKYSSTAQDMAAAMPRAELVIVPGAGHNVHLEQPDLFRCLVLSFLQSLRDKKLTHS